MQHQVVALDFPTKSETPTSAAPNAIMAQALGVAGRAIYLGVNSCSDPDQLGAAAVERLRRGQDQRRRGYLPLVHH
jgi:hypothetical protein